MHWIFLLTEWMESVFIQKAVLLKKLKVNNVMMDKNTGDFLTVIDLDTVMVGSALYDYGDGVRSTASNAAEDEQDLFFTNFKKTLTGQLDEKLFELKFQPDTEDPVQLKLNEALMTEDQSRFTELMLEIVERMLEAREYDHDIVISFIKGDYLKPQKKPDDDFTHQNDLVYDHQFILCTINKTQDPPKDLLFDYVEKTFKYQVYR